LNVINFDSLNTSAGRWGSGLEQLPFRLGGVEQRDGGSAMEAVNGDWWRATAGGGVVAANYFTQAV